MKICKPDGTVIFAGSIPPGAVQIYRPPNAPATCIVKEPVKDALAMLTGRPA